MRFDHESVHSGSWTRTLAFDLLPIPRMKQNDRQEALAVPMDELNSMRNI